MVIGTVDGRIEIRLILLHATAVASASSGQVLSHALAQRAARMIHQGGERKGYRRQPRIGLHVAIEGSDISMSDVGYNSNRRNNVSK